MRSPLAGTTYKCNIFKPIRIQWKPARSVFARFSLEAPVKLKIFLICLAVGVGVFGAEGAARAQSREECSRRIQRDQRELDRAIDQYGNYSSQARHERTELQRDAAKCGYFDYNNDPDDRWRDNRGPYDDGQSDSYGRRSYENPAADTGYRDGLAVGQKDRQKGKAFRPDKNDYYEDADHGYQRPFGDKGLYKRQYRVAFREGYADGYNDRR